MYSNRSEVCLNECTARLNVIILCVILLSGILLKVVAHIYTSDFLVYFRIKQAYPIICLEYQIRAQWNSILLTFSLIIEGTTVKVFVMSLNLIYIKNVCFNEQKSIYLFIY